MSEMSTGFHCRNITLANSVLGLKICFRIYRFRFSSLTCFSGVLVSSLEYYFGDPGSFPEGVSKSLFFSSDIKKFLLKTNGGETEPNFVIFFSLECFNCWWVEMVVGRSRDYCLGPAEIASFAFLVLFEDRRPSVNPRFHLFVSDVNQGNEEVV